MQLPDFAGAEQYALTRLEAGLAPALVYHSLSHTRDNVVPAVERLAAAARIVGVRRGLLRTAAWYHDLGFVEQRANHEAASVRIAAATLPRFGFAPAQVHAVGAMILATRLPQTPHTELEEILADADLDLLGWPDFLARNQLLRAELAAHGVHSSDAQWYQQQLNFLQDHHYFTAAAQALRDEQKQRNVLAMMELLHTAQTQAGV